LRRPGGAVWIGQLERARIDPDAEPFDLMVLETHIERARGWLEHGARRSTRGEESAA
jgi:hypothetical protein